MLAGPGVAKTLPGVEAASAPGARLLLTLWLPPPNSTVPPLCADIGALSYAFAPELERWKTGWLGRPGMRECREPLIDRACDLNAPARF